MIKIITYIICINFIMFAGEPLFVSGNQLIGSFINGQSIREVIGNVIVKQSNIIITCQRAVQNITQNTIEMLGNVVITQNNKVLTAPYVFYNGNSRVAEAKQGVQLIDENVILKAIKGNYNYREQTAFFYENVNLESDNRLLTCNFLYYYSNEGKAIAQDNVTLIDSIYRIKANQIIYYKLTKNALAKDKIEVWDKKENAFIYCNTLEYYHLEKKSYFYDNPYFLSYKDNDTVLIKANRLEISKEFKTDVKLIDSVHLFYGDIYSFSSFVRINNNDTIILPFFQYQRPYIIYKNSQFIGDSIKIFKSKNIIKYIDFYNNALITEKINIGNYRYNQVSAKKIKVNFYDNQPKYVQLDNNVLAYYYLINNDTSGNGVVKISADFGKIFLDSLKITDIKLYNDVQSDYYPEDKVNENEKEFFLYNFEYYEQKYRFIDILKFLKKDFPSYF